MKSPLRHVCSLLSKPWHLVRWVNFGWIFLDNNHIDDASEIINGHSQDAIVAKWNFLGIPDPKNSYLCTPKPPKVPRCALRPPWAQRSPRRCKRRCPARWAPRRWDDDLTRHPGQHSVIWVFPKIGVPQNVWFIMENPIKMDDLGLPLFSETSIWKMLGKPWRNGGGP